MDLSQLGESAQYMVPLIILFCMCIGYVIKTSLDFIENKLDINTHNIDLEFSENLMKKVEFSSTILTKKELITKFYIIIAG